MFLRSVAPRTALGRSSFHSSCVLNKKGLVLVDIQNDYFPGGGMTLHKTEEASKNAAKVLEYFRKNNLPVVHVAHEFPPSSFGWLEKGTKGAEIHKSVAPLPGEKIIIKNAVNSFKDTPLQETLKGLGVDELVVVGAMSHVCIDAAVRQASDFGYKCTVPEDACTCPDVNWSGKTVKAEQVHATIMGALSFYANVTSTSAVINPAKE